LRNGLLIGLISTLIISLTGGLSYGLSDRFSSQESSHYGLNPWLSDGLSILFPGMMVMWALSGGLTVWRHYVIRWLLARRNTFPFRAQAFLDDATARILLRRIGGGYSFIHRRLQDYFADTVVPPSEN
jgi:hypothetical protein